MSRIQKVGILGYGEIGKAMAKVCRAAGFKVYIRELDYDQLNGISIDYLHINIPEKDNSKFIKTVVVTIRELKPKLSVINSSITPGTTRKIFELTKLPIIHSPVIGVHPHLYQSIKRHFRKIIGPVNKKSWLLGKKHFTDLGLKIERYDTSEDSEAAKLLDLIYYAWNIIFCKWISEVAQKNNLNFNQIYTRQNQIYNEGYQKLRPNVIRPILQPIPGPIGGHCTVEDTILFDNFFKTRFTQFILSENEKYKSEKKN